MVDRLSTDTRTLPGPLSRAPLPERSDELLAAHPAADSSNRYPSAMDGDPGATVLIRLSGAIRAERAGTLVAIGSASQRRILGRLAIATNQVVSQDALVDLLWPDDPPRTAIASMHNHVHRLRSALGADRILRTAPGYKLAVDPLDVDINRFESLLSYRATGQPEHPVDGARVELSDMDSALALWSGPPLDEFRDESWARPTNVRMTEQHLIAQERRIEALLALRRLDEAVPAAEALCEEEPLRERANALLMRALAQQGRTAEALRVFDRLRKRMVSETGLEPSPALTAVERAVLEATSGSGMPDAPSAVRGPGARRRDGALPVQINALIGRSDDAVEVRALLSTGSLVTITGPGGVGKTQLALYVAHDLAPVFLDGGRFVDLSTVAEGDVDAAIATAIGAVTVADKPLDAAITALSGRNLLIVLDCCERVVVAVAVWASAILASCPMIRILATSRESLQVAGEQVFALAPLGPMSVDLFEVRARAVRRGFALSVANRPVVESICRAVDGLPLAIELAAACCDRLTLSEIIVDLEQHLASLSSGTRNGEPRHRGLSQVVDWSWRLLEPSEQVLLARMSVFPGGCTSDAAARVCGFEPVQEKDVKELLGSLVRKSLVMATLDGARARYRMLDTLRAYGWARLEDRREMTTLQRRLAEWAGDVLAETTELLTSPREAEGAALEDAEMANLSAALAWSVEAGETELAMRCLRPIIVSFRQGELLPPDYPIDRVPGWRDHPDAAYIYLRQAQRLFDPTAAGDAAFACSAHPGVPLFVAVWAHSAAIRVLAMWGRDPSAHLGEMRRLAATSTDAHIRLHRSFGERFAAGRDSPESHQWLSEARRAAIELGVPSMVAMAEYFDVAFRVDDESLEALRQLRMRFAQVGNTFMASLCANSIDQARPGTSRIGDVLATTRQAFRDSPMWLRDMARGRGEFLAVHGRNRAAAMLYGAIEETHLKSPWMGTTPMLDRAIADHPDAVEIGRSMSLEHAAEMLVAELESLADEMGEGTTGGL